MKVKLKFDELLQRIKDRKFIILFYIFFLMIYIVGSISIGELSSIEIHAGKLMIIFGIGILGILFFSDIYNLHNLVFFLILMFGLINCFVTPILDIPDEQAHLRRAELLSEGEFFVTEDENGNYTTIQSVINLEQYINKGMPPLFAETGEIDNTPASVDNVASSNLFIGYIPQAIGVSIAKILCLNEIWILLLGRCCNVIFAAMLARVAVKIVNKYKIQLFLISCFPMAVYIAGSVSIDVTIDYCALLAIAYFIKLCESSEKDIKLKQEIIFFGLCLVTGLSKITYMAIICLGAFIPKKNFRERRNYYFIFLIIVISSIIAIAWYLYTTTLPQPASHIEWSEKMNVNIGVQMSQIISNPIQMIHTLIIDMVGNFSERINSFFTYGWLSYGSLFLVYTYLAFYVAVSWLYPMEINFNRSKKIGIAATTFLIYIATQLIMYLTWTSVGSTTIDGVQGRYYIPLLALIPLIINSGYTKKISERIDLHCVTLVIAFLSMVPITTIIHYYI